MSANPKRSLDAALTRILDELQHDAEPVRPQITRWYVVLRCAAPRAFRSRRMPFPFAAAR